MPMLDKDGKAMKTLGMVRCPAHDDKTPSLWIGRDADGRLALKCLAGCAEADARYLLTMDEETARRHRDLAERRREVRRRGYARL